MVSIRRITGLLAFVLLLAGCESDNEHFCARYNYLYQQLLEDGNPSYGEMKQQLTATLNDPQKDKDQPRFMLFVLEDWYSEIKPAHETAKDFCLRLQRWQSYH